MARDRKNNLDGANAHLASFTFSVAKTSSPNEARFRWGSRCKTNCESQSSIRLIKWNDACDRSRNEEQMTFFIAAIKVTLVSNMDSHNCQGSQLALKRIRAAAGFARQYQQAAHETPNPQLMRVARALSKLN